MALKKSGNPDVETAIASDSSVGLSMDDPNNPNAEAELKDESGLVVEAGKKKVEGDDAEAEDEDAGDEDEEGEGAEGDGGDEEDPAGDDGAEGSEEDAEEGEADAAPKPLGKFDAKDVAKWDARYKKDGQFNMQALSSEFDRNIKDGTGKLDDDTYDYLASQGWPKADVQAIEAALVSQRKQFWDTTIANAGGKETLDAAIAWGKAGGYSKEQRERFNAVTKGSDPEAIQEALELLMTRYTKANGGKRKPFTAGDKPNRGNGASGGDVYKDKDEWRADHAKINEIRDAGKRQAKALEVRAKLKRSQKHWK